MRAEPGRTGDRGRAGEGELAGAPTLAGTPTAIARHPRKSIAGRGDRIDRVGDRVSDRVSENPADRLLPLASVDLPGETWGDRGAEFDPTGTYRYRLWRVWDPERPRVGFVMLNPSTADADRDDPTIRRCIGFARRWGFGGLEAANLFAYRATHPRDLRRAADPVGPAGDAAIAALVERAAIGVAAWGNGGSWQGRHRAIAALWPPELPVWCLGLTRAGQPRHPLYAPYRQPLQPWQLGDRGGAPDSNA